MSDFAHDMTLTVEEEERLAAVYAALSAPAVADTADEQDEEAA